MDAKQKATIARTKAIVDTPEFKAKRRRAHNELAARREANRPIGTEWPGVWGDPWILGSPIGLRELIIGDYIIDCLVEHRLRPSEVFEGGVPPEDARPVVRQITRLDRVDGEPLGFEGISLDLKQIAIDAVVAASSQVMVRRKTDNGWMYVAANSEDWRAAAQAVRVAAFWYGDRMRWTEALSEELVLRWSHMVEHGCGTAADLAAALGTTARRVQTQLNQLRNQGWTVPRGRPGRRVRKDDVKK